MAFSFQGVLISEVSSLQGVLISEVFSFQGVLISEVPSFQGVLISEVSSFQGVLISEVPSFQGVLSEVSSFQESQSVRTNTIHKLLSGYTNLLINSMLIALSCSALCRSANMRVSAAFSTLRLLHNDSSHIVFSLPRSY